MTRAAFEERLFGVLKWVTIVFLVIFTGFPLIYMIGLSFKPIAELVQARRARALR